MTNSEKISYKAVCDFFDGKNDITDHFNKLSFDNPAFGIFNEIEKLSLDLPVLKKFPKFTFKTIEQYLEDYFCSNISPAQAQHIKSAILVDESALQIFLYKIEQYKATPDTIIKSDNMQTMSNKGLFKIIKKTENTSQKPEKVSSLLVFNKSRYTLAAILSAAAAFLIIFLLPIQKKTNLQDVYNFDNEVPLDYYSSGLRGGSSEDYSNDPELESFMHIFKEGMADYLANDYLKAIEKWQVLEDEVPQLRKKENFDINEIDNFLLYYALCNLSLATSHKEQALPLSKQNYLQKSIEILEKIQLNSDAKKYYYALSLVLAGQKEKAVQILSTIKAESEYAEQSDVLLERINL